MESPTIWEETIAKDRKRQRELEQAGFTVIRFEDDEVLKNINHVMQAIESVIDQMEDPPPTPASLSAVHFGRRGGG